MRDAMSSNTTGRGRTPSNNPAVPGIPKGVCVKFQTGQSTYGSDCRFENVKAPKGKGKGKADQGLRPQGSIVRRVPLVQSPRCASSSKRTDAREGKTARGSTPQLPRQLQPQKPTRTLVETPPRRRRETRKRRRVAGLLLRIRKIRRVLNPSSLRDRQKAAMQRCASFRRWCAPRPSTRSPRILACLV